MDLSNIVIYVIVAVVLLFVLPKLGIGVGRGRGNSPLNPPGTTPGRGGGGGLFPSAPDRPDEPDRPAARGDAPRTSGDFADRVEGRGPEKKA